MPTYTDHDMLAPADTLATYLATVEGLSAVPMIVARQRNLQSELDAAVAKSTGAAILIALDGWENVVPDGSHCWLDLQHSISIWTNPVLRSSAIAESELLGLLVAAMQRYQPVPGDCDARWETRGGRYIPHPKHRVYEFSADYRLGLPAPTLVEP